MEKVSPKVRAYIDRGVESTKIIKDLTDEFETLKGHMKNEFGEGTYLGNKGVMVISEKTSFDTPTPSELLKYLKSVKMTDKFPECVKVMVTPTKKVVGEDRYDSLKGKGNTVVSISFK